MTERLTQPPPDFLVSDSHYHAPRHAAAHTTEYVFSQLIPYLGNKRKLLPLIGQAIQQTGVTGGLFVDFFAGSGVVARFAKQGGFQVIANDWEPYAQILNHSYIQCNQMPPFEAFGGVEAAFATLNGVAGSDGGYVATHLCPRSDQHPDPDTERLFFTRANGRKIDAWRETIQAWQVAGLVSAEEGTILLASLLYGVSYVSNTSGIFKGFHRGWGGQTGTALYRILSDITLRMPVLWDNGQENASFQLDAQTLAEQLNSEGREAAIAYLDPPYNQHPYGSNYHVLNTVALGDAPDTAPYTEGHNKSAIRQDWRTTRRSAYNHATALAAYRTLLQTISARHILTSYSTDGTMPLEDLLQAAAEHGHLSCVTRVYKRYRVSSQRMSSRPHTVEFVLCLDTARSSEEGAAEKIAESIRMQAVTAEEI